MPRINALNHEDRENQSFRTPPREASFLSLSDKVAEPRMSTETAAEGARNATLPPRSALAVTQEARRPLFRQR